MKYINSEETVNVPEGVTVQIKARQVTVTGPRGTLERNLRFATVAFTKVNDKVIKLNHYHGNRKQVAGLRTIKSILDNMIIGVTKGFKYKMRYVYAHFPINVNLENNGSLIEIRNFLGEKHVRIVEALEGVKVEISKTTKDELILTGNSVENVSQTAASIQQSCRVRNKDIRKFLDGIYVSQKGVVEETA